MKEPEPQRIQETRIANCRALIAQAGGIGDFGARIGMTNDNGQLSNTFGANPKKNIGDPLAARVEDAFGKRRGWLDIPWAWIERHYGQAATPAQKASPAPEIQVNRVENDVDALRYMIGAMSLMIAEKRPAEGAALAKLMRERVPKKFLDRKGSVLAVIEGLEEAVREAKARKPARPS